MNILENIEELERLKDKLVIDTEKAIEALSEAVNDDNKVAAGSSVFDNALITYELAHDAIRKARENFKKACVIKGFLIEYSKGEPNAYKEFYYMDKLASYGHIPAMKTLKFMKECGDGCNTDLEIDALCKS